MPCGPCMACLRAGRVLYPVDGVGVAHNIRIACRRQWRVARKMRIRQSWAWGPLADRPCSRLEPARRSPHLVKQPLPSTPTYPVWQATPADACAHASRIRSACAARGLPHAWCPLPSTAGSAQSSITLLRHVMHAMPPEFGTAALLTGDSRCGVAQLLGAGRALPIGKGRRVAAAAGTVKAGRQVRQATLCMPLQRRVD